MIVKRIRSCLAAALLAAAISASCAAQGAKSPPPAGQPAGRSVHVVMPNAGDYCIRVIPSSDAKGPAPLPVIVSGPEGDVRIDSASAGNSPQIAVDDLKSGTTAIVPAPKRATLMLQPVQFDHIRTVQVCVSRDGYAVKAATVTLQSGAYTSSVAVDPSMAGAARFDDVPIGNARLTVRYGGNFAEDRTTPLKAPAGGGPLQVVVAATNPVATLTVPAGATIAPTTTPATAKPGASSGSQGARQPEPSGGATPVVGEILGLLVAGGVLYGLYRLAQSGQLAAILKRAGVEVQPAAQGADAGTPWTPNAAPPPVVADPSVCPFCGQKKDASGGCACTIASGAAAADAALVAPSEPRLIGTTGVYAGAILALPGGGPATIGREPTNAIALPNDSTVSRRHASIQSGDGAFVLVDEGSSNGVYVNGVRITGSQPLHAGDEVQIGNTRFRFET